MNPHLFTYGTLQIPRIFQRVTGRLFHTTQATLEGHACCCVRGELYPGIKPFYGAKTLGTLYHNVDLQTLKCLDSFEGEYYKRVPVKVRHPNGTQGFAHVYIIQPAYYPILSSHPWRLVDFTQQRQDQFLGAYPFMPPP